MSATRDREPFLLDPFVGWVFATTAVFGFDLWSYLHNHPTSSIRLKMFSQVGGPVLFSAAAVFSRRRSTSHMAIHVTPA